MKKIIVLSLAISFLMTSCKNEMDLPLANVDSSEAGTDTLVAKIVFGQVYGACVGSCRLLYQLDSEAIYENLEIDPETPYVDTPFSTTALVTEKYELAKSLLTIPADLLDSTLEIEKQIVSDTDFYLRVETATGEKVWIWDDISEDADSEWKEYFDQLEATVLALRP